jgi:hypothetical protein
MPVSVEYRAWTDNSNKAVTQIEPTLWSVLQAGRFGYHIRVISVLLEVGKRNGYHKLDLGR